MEPDISILRKTGHFYFALTRTTDTTDHSLRFPTWQMHRS